MNSKTTEVVTVTETFNIRKETAPHITLHRTPDAAKLYIFNLFSSILKSEAPNFLSECQSLKDSDLYKVTNKQTVSLNRDLITKWGRFLEIVDIFNKEFLEFSKEPLNGFKFNMYKLPVQDTKFKRIF